MSKKALKGGFSEPLKIIATQPSSWDDLITNNVTETLQVPAGEGLSEFYILTYRDKLKVQRLEEAAKGIDQQPISIPPTPPEFSNFLLTVFATTRRGEAQIGDLNERFTERVRRIRPRPCRPSLLGTHDVFQKTDEDFAAKYLRTQFCVGGFH